MVAERHGRPVDGWELVLLVAAERQCGVATALVQHVLDEAARACAAQV